MTELVIVTDRVLDEATARRVRMELEGRGFRVVRIGGREIVIDARGFRPQFVPILIGILGALGIGIVSVILAGKVVSATESLADIFVRTAPVLAMFTALLAVSYIMIEAVK